MRRHDALGRVSARTQTRGSAAARSDSFGYNARSELTSATLVRTSTGTWSITYNGENRPIRFENAASQTVVECAYDSQGRRFEKKVTVAGTVTLHERYVYDGYLQIAAFDVAEGTSPEGESTGGESAESTLSSQLSLKRVVFWDSEEPTATRPLAINVLGDNLYFPTVDLTKNVCELVDFYGDIAATYDYAPFGAVSAGTPSGSAVPANPFQFSSEVYDSELDLVYYNYRHYSPADGRFLSRDPVEEQGGWNLYAFVKNCPICVFDLHGQACQHSTHKEKDGKRYGRTGTPSGTKPKENGCGSAGSEWAPDSFFWMVDFSKACNAHDRCYGTCGANKATCDINLGIDMANACLNALAAFAFLPSWGKAPLVLCLAQAATYSSVLLAVSAAGEAFESAQNEACTWEECCNCEGK